MRLTIMAISAAMLGACNQQPAQNQAAANAPAPAPALPVKAAAPKPAANAPAPQAKTALAEPTGPIDPTSVEAAGQVVQHYGALIEQRRWAEAEALWTHTENAREFNAGLKKNFREVHLEIGKPGDMEGAAGSIFVTVPVFFYGKKNDGSAFRSPANLIVRRVNDVPGSTQAQRRWHIDQIEGEDTGAG